MSNQATPPLTTRERADTTIIIKPDQQRVITGMNLQEYRDMVFDSARGQVIEVNMDFFSCSVLGDAQVDVRAVMDALVASGQIDEDTRRWSALRISPSSQPGTENDIFAVMAGINNNIRDAAVSKLSRIATVDFIQRPNNFAWSPHENGHFQSDGTGWKKETRSVDPRPEHLKKKYPFIGDCVSLEEYKRVDDLKNRKDDIWKLVGNATHILGADAGRRFIFGTTIEDEITRFWFFSRSHILVTKPFNFNENPEYLVRYTAALSIANDEELGYDPTVRRIWEQNSVQYVYSVGDRCFKTLRALDTKRVAMIVTRGSRVWEVVEVDPDNYAVELGGPYALKDTWLNHQAETEADILNHIANNINSVNPDYVKPEQANPQRFAAHFLSVVASGLVPSMFRHGELEKGEGYCTQMYTHGKFLPDGPLTAFPIDAPPEKKKRKAGPSASSGMQTSPSVPGTPEPHSGTMRDPLPTSRIALATDFEEKKQYRVVFTEVGKDLLQAETLHAVFVALDQTRRGLFYMFSAGYVHRDISTGNILIFPNGISRLSDLEYARRFDHLREKGAPKTGTPYFMAVEVLKGSYLYWHKDEGTLKEPIRHPDDRVKRQRGKRTQVQVATPPPFAHHYLHDMESLWWIAIYFYFRLPFVDAHRQYVQKSKLALFPREAAIMMDRYEFFAFDGAFEQHMERVKISEDDEHPLQVDLVELAQCLNDARRALLAGYQTLSTVPNFPCDCKELYWSCAAVASALSDATQIAEDITASLKESKRNHWAMTLDQGVDAEALGETLQKITLSDSTVDPEEGSRANLASSSAASSTQATEQPKATSSKKKAALKEPSRRSARIQRDQGRT